MVSVFSDKTAAGFEEVFFLSFKDSRTSLGCRQHVVTVFCLVLVYLLEYRSPETVSEQIALRTVNIPQSSQFSFCDFPPVMRTDSL